MSARSSTRRGRHGSASRRLLGSTSALAVACGLLAGCSASASGKPELVWYTNPDTGGQASLAEKCSTDDYTITTQTLPQDAGEQRIQLARRLAAEDSGIDLMSLDPPFTAEFANAGYLKTIEPDLRSKLEKQSFEGATKAATWEDELVVAPFWSNTQVLWYRKSFAEKAGLDLSATKTATWEELIQAAEDNGGKFGVQGVKAESLSVWVNALIAGAGGQIATDTEAGADAKITINSEAGRQAAKIMGTLGRSDAAASDLSVANEGSSASTFAADDGAYQVNWTFIWSNYDETDPDVKKDMGYAPYPESVEGEDSRPPYGGIGLGISEYSNHPDEAMKAVECITSPENQAWYAVDSGNMPASPEGYQDAELKKIYGEELLQLFQDSVDKAAPRTVSPYWSDISLAIQSTWHSPGTVTEDGTPKESATFIEDVLQGRTLQ